MRFRSRSAKIEPLQKAARTPEKDNNINMKAIDFLKRFAETPLAPLYVVFGDEVYLRREAIEAIIKSALGDDADELAITRFAGEKAKLADVVDEVRTLPFLSERRVVLVEDADAFVTSFRKPLEAYAEKPYGGGVLVLSVKSWPATTKLYKLIEQTGLSIDCKPLPPGDLAGLIVRIAKTKFKTEFHADAARLLVELVGDEIGLLASEVEKLSTFVGKERVVRAVDVAKLVEAGRVQEIWKAIDSATLGNVDVALSAIDGLLNSGEEPLRLMGAISSSLRKIYHAGKLRLRGLPPNEACKAAGIMYSGGIEKTLRQHARMGRERVDRIPELLLRADRDLKGGSQLPPRIILERLMLEIARPRTDLPAEHAVDRG